MSTSKRISTQKLTRVALLAAVSTVLMFFSINVPLMPSFIKLDLSELPALIAAYSFGPIAGATVCLVKNLVNVWFTTTGGVGELSNFILGCAFVVPAGLVYGRHKSRAGALWGAVAGAAAMALLSMLTNYYVIYPIYTAFMPMEAIMGAYQAINPNVQDLWQALACFNLPFTFLKGMLSVAIAFLIYKPLSPWLHARVQ